MGEGIGVGLGVTVALLWGSADTLATLISRRIGTLRMTIISQSVGMSALLFFGCFILWSRRTGYSPTALQTSILIGIFTGLCAALGYFAFYQALSTGPLALISPLTASSSSLTFLLALLAQQESLPPLRIGYAVLVLLGVMFASINMKDFQAFSPRTGVLSFNVGVRWGIVALIAFSLMDFGIGTSASISGWFLPVFWTRLFSLIFLVLFVMGQRNKRYARRSKKPLSPGAVEPVDRDQSLALARHKPSVVVAEASERSFISPTASTISTRLPSLRRIIMVPVIPAIPTSPGTLPDRGSEHSPPLSFLGREAHFSAVSADLWVGLAGITGVIENIAVLMFSADTRVATTGIAAALGSSYGLFAALFGVVFYGERLDRNQLYGIALCLLGIFLLAL